MSAWLSQPPSPPSFSQQQLLWESSLSPSYVSHSYDPTTQDIPQAKSNGSWYDLFCYNENICDLSILGRLIVYRSCPFLRWPLSTIVEVSELHGSPVKVVYHIASGRTST